MIVVSEGEWEWGYGQWSLDFKYEEWLKFPFAWERGMLISSTDGCGNCLLYRKYVE